MASGYEVEVIISSAKDLKNVNWRHGPLRPYAVVWVEGNNKCSTKVDEEGDTGPTWDETLVLPLSRPVDGDTKLCVDIVHAGAEEDTKPLIGSARLNLRDVLEEVGLGERSKRTLKLKRPSGRPQGKLEVTVTIKEPRYPPPQTYNAPPYGVPPPASSRDYPAPPPYGQSYAPPPPYGQSYAAPPQYGQPPNPYYSTAQPPSGYPYGGYGASQYGQPSYDQVPSGEGRKSKLGGMGTGLAVGAVAGALGGLALAEGFDALEDKIADDVEERVEDDLGDDF